MKQSRLKRLLRRAVCTQPANTVLRGLLKSPPLSWLAPQRMVRRIPVAGRIAFQLPNSRRLVLQATGTDKIATRLYWDGIDGHEPDTFRVFVRLLVGSRVFLDIGANTGIFALYAAMNDPMRRVHAFEPLPEVAECLRRTAAINGLNNLWVESAAVGDHNGEATLYVPERADSSFPTDASTRPGFRDHTRTIVTPAVTLILFVADRRLEGVESDQDRHGVDGATRSDRRKGAVAPRETSCHLRSASLGARSGRSKPSCGDCRTAFTG